MPPRARAGTRRIDAAIAHFGAMGYAARDVRSAVRALLKVYGGDAAWPLLEEDCYLVVQTKLFEMEEEGEKKQQHLLLEHHPEEEQEDKPPPQPQGSTADMAPEYLSILEMHNNVQPEAESEENNMPILEVHKEGPAGAEPEDEEPQGPVFAKPPASKVLGQLPAARRLPSYGWISSESESEDEEQTSS
ncbi:hypothetical protein ACP4OV_019143 [Aristida adscensionis]